MNTWSGSRNRPIMIIDLNWKYVGSHEKLWQGRGIGLWSTVVFTISFEDQKPIGILMGDGKWETDDIIKLMIEKSHRPNKKIVFDDNPQRLVAKLLQLVAEDRKLLRGYKNYEIGRASCRERVSSPV